MKTIEMTVTLCIIYIRRLWGYVTKKPVNETFEKIKDQLLENENIDINEMKDFIGKKLFMRTVTYHIVGKVEKIVGSFFILSDASWIADSGRFMNAITEGELNEVEPLGDWVINYHTITDMGFWKHTLKLDQQ